jgi:hypothetical protein
MTVNNAINSPLPTILSLGGTNAALTASNGGVFYSTGSATAILSGTATANQMLQSGASGAPSWSTATYPATTTANQLLYSSATNVVDGLSTTGSACLVTNSSGIPSWTPSMTNGQVIIGSTSGTPTPATLTAGTNITITNGPGSITIDSTAGGSGNYQWIATQTASSSASLNFDNQFSSSYIAYRLVLKNILAATDTAQLWLRFGTGTGPITYISSGYIYQTLEVTRNSFNQTVADYKGYTGTGSTNALLAYGNNFGTSNNSTYGGVCGYIDLFVTAGSSKVANGISQMSFKNGGGTAGHDNTKCFFQQPAASFTSVQLLMSTGNIVSGSAYLYGLT